MITFQLGHVDPLVSVSYRFLLGGIILLAYAKWKDLQLQFSLIEHVRTLQQGVLLFGMNYWLVYLSEQTLTSGLVAVAFSTIIFFNIGFGAIFLKAKVNGRVVIGAILGLTGTILIYRTEFISYQSSDEFTIALLYCIGSVVFASLGNITSAYNQSKKMPVIQTTAFGMIYGALAMGLIALIAGKSFTIDWSITYLASLFYLAFFGSVIAFTAYLTLIGRVGAGQAAYAIVIVPVIAITISSFFENYRMDFYGVIGIISLVIGNIIAMRKK